jgi:hypothetical protein
MQLGGGVDTGRTVNDRCFAIDSPQELLYCRVVTPFKALTQVKLFGSYRFPGEFVASGILQSVPGPTYNADYQAPNAAIAPSLGRNLAACGAQTTTCTATATVPLIAPQSAFEARRTQLDLRVTKLVKLGPKLRLQANVDAYNVLNATSLLGVNSAFGPQWRYPAVPASTIGASILNPRIFQFSGRLSF